MEIRRFGVGNRRPDGPPGTFGVTGQVLHTDRRGVISELAFTVKAGIEPHSNPNTTWFVVIEGGGFVGVGADSTRVAAGEAVLWPAGTVHSAWTDGSHMRAIVVEFAGADDSETRALLEGGSWLLPSGDQVAIERGDGALAETPREPIHDPDAGEPL
ncbi:MAG TPA: cupin domain-containing protein [Candidatus Limnocylindrales bacterium]|nr:cupin domain-containing protein [Candidatus Limnocylindrales bacterium]